ncbi:unnamed protein product [Mytilus edulis]|uniref:Interferon-induced very large GTPase 1-like n=1 Tax=Mytilus edulis TaxID=6550 RepID=A0A8S3R2P4_MYTED|nr:unnamed protein product [Mytilus edulis]
MSTIFKLTNMTEECILNAFRDVDEKKTENYKLILLNTTTIEKDEKEINERVKELTQKMKGKQPTEEELKHQFNNRAVLKRIGLDERFNSVFITELLDIIMSEIDDFNDSENNAFNILDTYRALLAVHICNYATVVYEVPEGNMDDFSDFVRREVDTMEQVILANFKSKTKQNIVWSNENPIDSLFLELWGCNKHCPFCCEPCQFTISDHLDMTPHKCLQHRIPGLVEYKKYIPDWDIAPDSTLAVADYWAWVTATFEDKINEMNSPRTLPEIPASWTRITKQQAKIRFVNRNKSIFRHTKIFHCFV